MIQTIENKIKEIKARPYFIQRDETLKYQVEVNKADKDFLIYELESAIKKLTICVQALNQLQLFWDISDVTNVKPSIESTIGERKIRNDSNAAAAIITCIEAFAKIEKLK